MLQYDCQYLEASRLGYRNYAVPHGLTPYYIIFNFADLRILLHLLFCYLLIAVTQPAVFPLLCSVDDRDRYSSRVVYYVSE